VVLAGVGSGLCISARFPERRSAIFKLGNLAGVILISTGIFYSSQCVYPSLPCHHLTAETQRMSSGVLLFRPGKSFSRVRAVVVTRRRRRRQLGAI
jgi:hypothetical protein